VMDLHRLGVDVRFECVVWVRQGGKLIGHDQRLLSSCCQAKSSMW
jgi:hypothetical protein